MARQIPAPDCLGKIAEFYCNHCGEMCPLTALCVLVSMGDYLKQNHKVPPSQDSTNNLWGRSDSCSNIPESASPTNTEGNQNGRDDKSHGLHLAAGQWRFRTRLLSNHRALAQPRQRCSEIKTQEL